MALLSDRGVVAVTGEDAGRFLQGLITNDIALLGVEPAIFAGLLTPQGKILFDFFVVRGPGGYLLETAREKAADIARRLAMYKLRAQVEITDVSAGYAIAVYWDGPHSAVESEPPGAAYPDPRLAELGSRTLVPLPMSRAAGGGGAVAATSDSYHAHRIALGVPEGGKDYAFGDTFPHEALFDQLGGVSFAKGCFVGQEVVSRMEHRATIRKRVVPVVGESELPAPGTHIMAGPAAIGTLGSVAGQRGLALLRLDRVGEARANGVALSAGKIEIEVELPAFATFSLAGVETGSPA